MDLRGIGLLNLYCAVRPAGPARLPRPVRPSDRGEVDARRPLAVRGVPPCGHGLCAFLGGQTLIRTSPVRLFAGSPLYVLYLRALGARIGKGVTILSHTIPVCTDLLTVGEGTIIRKDVLLSCYRAHASIIQPGPVTLGGNVLVSERTVLDIETSMGDGAQLGHASSLHTGQVVPPGEHRHSSPRSRPRCRLCPGGSTPPTAPPPKGPRTALYSC